MPDYSSLSRFGNMDFMQGYGGGLPNKPMGSVFDTGDFNDGGGGGYGFAMPSWGGYGGAKAGATGSGSMMDSFFRQKNAEGMTSGGYGELGLGLLSGGVNTYLGFQQYKQAKEGLKQQKQQFDMNYAAARQTTNTAMEDRQKARVASNGSAYESVDSYMNRNRIA